MRYFSPLPPGNIFSQSANFARWSAAKLALAIGLPLIGLVLLITLIISAKLADDELGHAISRNINTRTIALSLEIERLLAEARTQTLSLAAGPMDRDDLARRLKARSLSEGLRYRELAFIGLNPEDRFLMLNYGGETVNVSPETAREARHNPFESISDERRPGHVFISAPLEVVYSMIPVQGVAQNLPLHVLRFTTPVYDSSGVFNGLLILSLDLTSLRDTFSFFRSPESPFTSSSAGGAQGRAFMFDLNGWMLFQSETAESQQSGLSCEIVRSGLRGDFGRPGFSIAFRPAPEHESYWAMVSDAQAGKYGQINVSSRFEWPRMQYGMENISYAPIRFKGGPDSPFVVVAGLACLDPGNAAMQFSLRLLTNMAAGFLMSLLLITVVLFVIGKALSKNVLLLAREVRLQSEADCPQKLEEASRLAEFSTLRSEINGLLDKFVKLNNKYMTHKAAYDAERQRRPIKSIAADFNPAFRGVVGNSRAIRDLRLRIQKAAQVMADILITGETGTGKEMAAETIHREGESRGGEFITINCGALDENLLMDTLFGHVKGAFTEARADRKGAFLAAENGTLLLDEIGNASLKVQQALLRALAARCIRPLGSDQDTPFSARIIAATNVDLLECVRLGTFREDLYHRLAVITIKTPPLREHKEDIPLLASHFLHMSAAELKCRPAVLTQGALEKLLDHDWPGNVRELKNCITRAMTFSSSGFIYAESLIFNGANMDFQAEAHQPEGKDPAPPMPPASQTIRYEPDSLNRRQKTVWAFIVSNGGISRQEYQNKAGEEISMRTAQYDLQDLVSRGILIKSGRGPSSSYILADNLRRN